MQRHEISPDKTCKHLPKPSCHPTRSHPGKRKSFNDSDHDCDEGATYPVTRNDSVKVPVRYRPCIATHSPVKRKTHDSPSTRWKIPRPYSLFLPRAHTILGRRNDLGLNPNVPRMGSLPDFPVFEYCSFAGRLKRRSAWTKVLEAECRNATSLFLYPEK